MLEMCFLWEFLETLSRYYTSYRRMPLTLFKHCSDRVLTDVKWIAQEW